MVKPRHSSTREATAADRYVWLLVLVVPILLAGTGTWLFAAARDTGDNRGSLTSGADAGSDSVAASENESDSDSGAPEALSAAAEACRTLWESDGAGLAAASATLEQWRAHVGAQVDFNNGTITADETKARWAASKEGAAEKSAAFEQADAAYQAQLSEGDAGGPLRCAVPRGDASGELAAQVQTCAESLAVHQSTLEAARTAHAGWKKHQAEMEALAAGEMARVDELTSWEVLWREGLTNLAAYDERAAKAEAATCPLADNAAG